LRYWISTDGNVVMSVLPAVGDTAPTVTRLAETAKGLNPLLRHFGMAIHPPMLYLGFVSFIIPFSFAMAALASGELSTNWIKASRRWTLVAWIFLSLGLVLGGRWAYDVLGWGGYWGWDPVENAAFLPWLMGTAFLHSIMIQEKRGMLKTWNMFLSIGTFSAVIFGTFATRSGLVESVHSFARSGIGFPMFFFWLSLTLISVSLILWRQSQGMLQAEHSFTSLLSRETLFVVNNLVFISLFAIIFWWSFGMPIISELFFDTVTTYGPETFNTYTPWLFLALYILMGIAPLSAWGATSLSRLGKALLVPLVLTIATVALFAFYGMNSIGAIVAYGVILPAGYVALYETYRGYRARRHIHKENPLQTLQALFRRNPRRYGGYLVHLGVTIIGIGIIGSTVFQQETQHTLSIGESMFFNGYELRYDSLETGLVSQDGRIIDRANLTLFKDGREVAPLRPRRDYFGDQGQSMTIASAHSTLQNDFYVIMVGWEEISQRTATFKIFINPLINLIWSGSLILIIGTILAAWPHPALSRQTKRSQVHSTLAKGATA